MTAIFPRPPSPDDGARDLEAFIPLTRLAALSETLAAQPLGPSATFRTELRARLLAEHAATAAGPASDEPDGLVPVRVLAPTHRHPAVRGAAAGIALVLAGGGVAAAAAGNSLPGDTLHPLKRFTESVRNAVDPHRDQPSHVLQEIDVRLSELQRSSRPTLGATPRGVALERWPAMRSTLSDIATELNRLEPRAADPTVRAALVERRQRLVGILPTLTAQQQPAVQQLIAQIDAMTGSPAGGGVLSLPVPGVRAPALAVAGGIDDVLDALRTAPGAVAGVTTPPVPGSRTAAATRRSASASSTGTGTRTSHSTGTRTVSTSTPSASASRATTASQNAVGRTARTAPMVRTVTVTVTTVTTRTADGVATTRVGPATRTVTTTAGVVGAAAARTVSTTTRTVVTSTGGSTLPASPLTSRRSTSTSSASTHLPGALRNS